MIGLDPSHCSGYWSPIVAAGPQSALSGVLAGFVFTAMTVVLSTNPERREDTQSESARHVTKDTRKWRSYALQLFAAAFIIFALDSYFTSVSAGELACNRAYAESALSGGILGVGAILMIAGLAWLIATYVNPDDTIADVITYSIGSVWVVTVVMLAISGMDVGEAMLGNRWQSRATAVLWVIAAVMVIVMVTLVLSKRRLTNPKKVGSWVKFTALSGLGAGALCGLSIGIVSTGGTLAWAHPDPSAVYVVVLASIFIPAIPLFSSVPAAMAARAAAKGSANIEHSGRRLHELLSQWHRPRGWHEN